MFKLKPVIEEGDTVIIYINPKNLLPLCVQRQVTNKEGILVNNILQTMYGSIRVESLIGLKYGSKINLSRGWAYVLFPSTELWTLTVPHRTQVIYTPDQSLILHYLDLRPGHIVLEGGTGSGSLTHTLARTVLPNGYIHTFELNSMRSLIAELEFESHGISNLITIHNRDVTEGFGSEMDFIADAVFLDLPKPWLAIPHVLNCIKKSGGRFASFSPCIEQVQNTCVALRKYGFLEIENMECLLTEYNLVNVPKDEGSIFDVNGKQKQKKADCAKCLMPEKVMAAHTGYLTFASLPPYGHRQLISISDEGESDLKKQKIGSTEFSDD